MRRILLAVAVLLLLAPAARAAEGDVRLSDERELSRYAHANGLFGVRVKPVAGARRVDRLRYRTEDGLPEVYLALRSRTTRGAEWVEIRLPGRPNGRTGWVPREALGPLRKVTTSLVVDRSRFRAARYRDGERIWSSRVGVGAPGTPTPKGRFYIRQKLRNLGGSSAYGPWAFGTSAYSVLSGWRG